MIRKMSAILMTGLLLALPRVTAADDQVQDVYDPFRGEWSLQVTPDVATASEGQSAFGEAVLFHNGEFSAAAFAMFGFAPASYSVADNNGLTVFTSVLSSEDRGTLTWTGHISATGMAGELVWARPGGVNYRFVVVGERAAQ